MNKKDVYAAFGIEFERNTRGEQAMKYEVIVDGEWYFEGTFERCCDIVNEINSDPDFWGSCYMMSEEEFSGSEA